MSKYPEICDLKSIPINEKTNLSPVYSIPIGPGSLKIEKKILSKKYGEKEIVGWRLFVKLDIISKLNINSIDPVFKLPIQKIKGDITDFYQIYLDPRFFRQIENPQNPQQPQITHPIIELIMNYVNKNYNNIDYNLTIDKIREARREQNNGLNFSILTFDERISDSLIIPSSNQKGYLNPEETDLLSLDDISNINLRIPLNLDSSKEIEIKKLLNNMFLDEDFKNANGNNISTRDFLEIYSCVKDYLNGKSPSHNGLVLYGPPGSGKTHLIQESLMKIYEILGFQTHFQEIGDMLSNQYVGGLATNVSEKIFGPAIQKIKRYQVPCFVYIDEATDLLKKTKSEGDSGWRSQGIEAMKSFINKSRYPGIIVCLATNLEKNEFDDALTRDGRLYPIYLGLPNFERSKQVWNYVNEKILFSNSKNNILTTNNIDDLSNICKDKINVAAITGISETYISSINQNWNGNFDEFKEYFGNEAKKRLEDEFNRSKSNLESINNGNFIGSEELKKELKKLKLKYNSQLHDIELALDPSKPSTKEGIKNLFQSLNFNKKKISKRYKLLYNNLINWNYITIVSNKLDPFSKQSLKYIKLFINQINWLETNFDEEKLNSLSESFNLIKNFLFNILNVNENNHSYSELSIRDLNSLSNTIKNLPDPDELFRK